ncbi:hypothetical protein [Faecalibacterium sp. AM43-5AT]|jgi:uncharacterized repeat protein (TIGR02543 family)|uniref:hypothetical protein n=1 Tax=Faecalibacterium sp. AM43-5AT TaxID=2302957 RepID=UPI000E70A872|nr:hypothetical protein [Faecalibacterium sp. AM43-5AT]RJV95016.1 hypothetical protein DW937_10870 [Faecalibacterium sp. AM43-5AT]
MKLRTRKFLAGLLSLGLLLQAASPLSALAAEGGSAAHTLTVTVGNTTYNLTANGETVSFDVAWPLGYPTVSYDKGFAFEGGFNGDVILNGGENVTIKGESYAVNGSLNATVNDLTVTKSDSGTDAAIRGDATITSAGDVRISGNLDYNNISLVNQAVEGKLTVNSAQDVSIDGILNGGADINCQTLSLNCGNGSTVSGTLTVHNAQKIQATAFAIYGVIGDRGKAGKLVLDHCTGAVTLCNTYGYEAVQAGTVEVRNLPTGYVARYYAGSSEAESTETEDPNDCARYSYFRIEYVNPSNKTLTLTNAKAYTDAAYTTELINATSANGTSTYHVDEGKTVYVKAVAPDETQQWMFKGWTGSNKTDKEINVTVHENMALTANWKKVTDQATNYGIKVTIGNNPPIEVTSENCGHILGVGNDKLTYDPDTHTLTGTGSFGKMKVEITDDLEDKVDVVLSNANGAVVNGSLTVTGAQDVKVTGVSSTALITGDATITCAGDILMDNTGSGNVLGYGDHGNLDVQSAQNVTIHGEGRTGTDEDGNNYTIYGRAEIECSGNVEITSQNGGAVWDPVVITKADNVTITAAQRAVWDSRSYLDSSINCSGKVKITSKTAAALHDGKLTINGATDVTISGKRDEGATIGGDAEITCSGDVVLENKGTGAVVESKLVYTQSPAKGYEVKTGKNAESATVAYTDEEGTTSYTVPNTETNPETNPVPSYISITAVGTPPVVPGDDDFTGGDSGAGGAVAAVLVGGAAVWGGYEIATRVILHNILPEGAEIPANRGQLALLVWNTAGRPEPVNTPAFADVADADTAKAAQWCVEQGLLDAKSESSFKPEGWMPKFKTIEVWEKAFPKQ